MPKMVSIQPNKANAPNPKASAAEKAQWKAIVAHGTLEMDFASAVECVANSNGLYEIAEPKATPISAPVQRLEDMSSEELKRLYFSIGGKVDGGKQLRRADVIAAIQTALDQVDIVDEIPDED